ncbi:filaggrin-2-like isoform X2 [Hyalella azteca]|uniref:Filaggrin-2-like isoform X2 n=1 Tax=Hyalella azteca TaxID=294128 RepID=A0A979FW53_HYAAZ|nr:filaggrin-2-like isoform X2 [Hyalella azteca]
MKTATALLLICLLGTSARGDDSAEDSGEVITVLASEPEPVVTVYSEAEQPSKPQPVEMVVPGFTQPQYFSTSTYHALRQYFPALFAALGQRSAPFTSRLAFETPTGTFGANAGNYFRQVLPVGSVSNNLGAAAAQGGGVVGYKQPVSASQQQYYVGIDQNQAGFQSRPGQQASVGVPLPISSVYPFTSVSAISPQYVTRPTSTQQGFSVPVRGTLASLDFGQVFPAYDSNSIASGVQSSLSHRLTQALGQRFGASQPLIGQPGSLAQKPSFSQSFAGQPSAVGQSVFGQNFAVKQSDYGQSPLFGSSGFGQATAAGQSSFVQPSVTGQQGATFGQPAVIGQQVAFGLSQLGQTFANRKPTPFGQQASFTAQTQGFGTQPMFAEQPTLVQSPGFGQQSTFAQHSVAGQQSGFGQHSTFAQPSVAGQQSGFGQQSTFAQPSVAGQQPGFGLQSTFAQPSVAGQQPGFGQQSTFAQPSLTGQTSTFGQQTLAGQQPGSGVSTSQGSSSPVQPTFFGQSATLSSGSQFQTTGQTSGFAAQPGSQSPQPVQSNQPTFGVQRAEGVGFNEEPPQFIGVDESSGAVPQDLATFKTNVAEVLQGYDYSAPSDRATFSAGANFGDAPDVSVFDH